MIDLSTRAEILYMMKELQEKRNLSYIYITHDLSTARYFADRIAVMEHGHLLQLGTPEEVYREPTNDTIASFLGLKDIVWGEDGSVMKIIRR